MDTSVNYTVVIWFPKVPSPTHVKDYRSIDCCTTVHKIITKMLTGRLKSVIDVLICDVQCAFIEGRCITDSILFAHELLKGYNRKGISLRCVLKVDIRKAYDSLIWAFLKR